VKTRTRLILAAVVIAAAVAGWLLVKDDVRNLFAILGAGGLASLLKVKKPTVNEAAAKKAGEDAKEKVLDTPPDAVISGLDADTRARIDDAKQAGIYAGLAALYGSASKDSNPGGT
jgi:hypothetical protein